MKRAACCWQAVYIHFGSITEPIFFMSSAALRKELGGLGSTGGVSGSAPDAGPAPTFTAG